MLTLADIEKVGGGRKEPSGRPGCFFLNKTVTLRLKRTGKVMTVREIDVDSYYAGLFRPHEGYWWDPRDFEFVEQIPVPT